ncbi:MAG: family 43 glycosylhydrolase [Phycisphaeraceae bacterium]|nr:MAG: family 43 glycosylhydrolase [Phycisphaeraceae bacterium]
MTDHAISRRRFTAAALATPMLAGALAPARTSDDDKPGDSPLRHAIGPVLPGLFADPHISRFGDSYYIYPTTDGQRWMSTSFQCFASKDLVHWEARGVMLDLANVTWAESKAWAPAMAQGPDKRFYFYFTAQDRVGVAASDHPDRQFSDALGRPLIERNQFDTYPIDPMVFTDDDGASYIYFGNGRCYGARLKPNMIELEPGTARDVTPEGPTTEFREGSFMLRRGGTYHLTWSVNDTRSPDYQVHAATADNPFGPFTIADNVPILFRDGVSRGTAHHSIVRLPGDDNWAICFHRFAVPGGDGMNREVCLAPLTFDNDGHIERVDISALRQKA